MSVSRLNILPKEDYFPQFQQPSVIGFYSVNENRQYCPSSQNIKYLCRTNSKVKFNLNAGFENYIPKTENIENEEKIDSILLWLHHRQYLRNIIGVKEEKCTFICFRGLLTTVMRTPYEQQDGWFIVASKVKNVIFLCAFYTDEKKRELQRGKSPKDERFTYWGYKFEQYMLTDNPVEKPDISKFVNANEEFTLMFRSKLGEHYILYGAETDGIDSNVTVDLDTQVNKINPAKFIELKTSRFIQNDRQDKNFKKFKLLKWWSQCFIVGIENIICGFRDDNGFVHKLENFKTKDLPKISNKIWNPCVCMRFLEDFLCFIKENMKSEPDLSQRRFDWKPNWKQVLSEKITQPSPYQVLPDWFINECQHFSNVDK